MYSVACIMNIFLFHTSFKVSVGWLVGCFGLNGPLRQNSFDVSGVLYFYAHEERNKCRLFLLTFHGRYKYELSVAIFKDFFTLFLSFQEISKLHTETNTVCLTH